MINFKYDFSFLFTMIKFVFLPVLAIVIVTAIIIFAYSKKVKQQDIKKYNYLVEFWTTLLAILIIGALFAITIGFSMSLSKAIEMYDLVKGNEIIYYLVLVTPIIPLIFLAIYIYRMIIVILNKPKETPKKLNADEIVPEPSNINYDQIDSNIEEITPSSREGEILPPLVITEENKDIPSITSEKELIEKDYTAPIVVSERKENSSNDKIEEDFSDITEKEIIERDYTAPIVVVERTEKEEMPSDSFQESSCEDFEEIELL